MRQRRAEVELRHMCMSSLDNALSKLTCTLATMRSRESTEGMKRFGEARWRVGSVNGDDGAEFHVVEPIYTKGKTMKCRNSLRGTRDGVIAHNQEMPHQNGDREERGNFGRKRRKSKIHELLRRNTKIC